MAGGPGISHDFFQSIFKHFLLEMTFMRPPFFIGLFSLVTSLAGGFANIVSAEDKNEISPTAPASYVEEAPLPESFPPPGKIGEVIEKTYPTVRSYSAAGTGAFMKCFGYLSLNQHKMTAPVIMEVAPDAKAAEKPRDGLPFPITRMHFLLEKNSLDEPKTSGPITVADMPSVRVLSIAFQEKLSAEAAKKGQTSIEARLSEMPKFERAGDYRILGYNSPMLEKSKNFWEIQLPIKEREESTK
jgi:hypothetical protein